MGRAHQYLQLRGRALAALQLEQAARQQCRLVLRFHPEEFQHRKVAQILKVPLVHVRLRFKLENNSSALRKPTDRSRQNKIPWV